MILSLIAATGKNNELGKDNKLLWDLPADMRHFRETTSGHPVIMGRKTFESIGRPLPNRRNIVLSRSSEHYQAPGCENSGSVEEILESFKNSNEEVFVIGGAQIYKLFLPHAHRLYLTKVGGEFDADAFFPEFGNEWKEISRDDHLPDETHLFPYSFVIYERVQDGS
jgi:dihydrofolate reductase